VTVLDSEQIKALWADPLLRTSDVLSALFHDAALICEGETDARFYRTVLDATRSAIREADGRFFHFGGKDRIASVVAALRALNVPVIAIVDIDLLADRQKFLILFEALGGRPADVENDLKTILRVVGMRKGQLTAPEM
jgi:hypothetical protein